MKLAILLLTFSIASLFADAPRKPSGAAFNSKMPIVSFEKTTCIEALSFFRAKATFFLREKIPSDSAVVTFEYRFDPKEDGDELTAKLHSKIDYEGKNVTVAEAMAATLHRYGLAYKIVSPTKVVIYDKPHSKKK